jgi:hypothetical protein
MNGWRQVLVSLGVLGAGMFLGSVLNLPETARGEVRATPQPPAFQSGGQLSVPILREIADTLRQMDGRLARLEIVAKQLPRGPANQAARN